MSHTPDVQITGKMFLYERPELLNKDQHANYGINPTANPYAFCAKVRAVPLTAVEFGQAARHFPIVFHAEKDFIPLAVLGLVDDTNLFVDEHGRWEQDVYVPAYLRRYPFAVANETGGDRLAIVVDAAFSGFSVAAQMPFFVNGAPSPATAQMIDFCRQYEADRRQTDELMRQLQGLAVVSGQQTTYTDNRTNQVMPVANYFGVDEAKLRALPDARYLEMRASGLIGLVHAQLWSMANWRDLMARRARRFNLSANEALSPLRLS